MSTRTWCGARCLRKRVSRRRRWPDFDFVLATTDGFALAFYLRAKCFAQQKDYERAVADLDRALEHDPQHEKAAELKRWCEVVKAG